MEPDKKLCPYCGEEIKAVAKKCRHCGAWLDDSSMPHEITDNSKKSYNHKSFQFMKYAIMGAVGVAIIGVIVFMLVHSDSSSMSNYSPSANEPSADGLIDAVREDDNSPGAPIEEVPEYILTHDEDGNGKWVKNPDYIDGSHLYDGTEDGD